jgi:hypothetical protein
MVPIVLFFAAFEGLFQFAGEAKTAESARHIENG